MDYETFRKKAAENQKRLEGYQDRAANGAYRIPPLSSGTPTSPPGKYDTIRNIMSTYVPPTPAPTHYAPWTGAHADEPATPTSPVETAVETKTPVSHPPAILDDIFGGLKKGGEWIDKHLPFLGKASDALWKADTAVSDFKAGALDTATLGVTQGIGRAAIKSMENMDTKPVAPILNDVTTPHEARAFLDNQNKAPEDKSGLSKALDNRLGSTSYKVGQFAGYLAPATAIDKAVVKVGGKALEKLAPVAQAAVRGGVAGALDSTAQELGDVAFRKGKFDPLNVALGAGLGGGIGAAIPAIAPYISKGIQKLTGGAKREAQRLSDIEVMAQQGKVAEKQNYITNRLKDVDEQISSLESRVDKGGSYADEMQTLHNERSTLHDYAKAQNVDVPSPTPVAPRVQPEDILLSTPPKTAPTKQVNPLTLRATTVNPDALHVAQAEVINKQAEALKHYMNDDHTLVTQLESRLKNTKGEVSNNDIRLAEDYIKRLQTAGTKPAKKASDDLQRAINLADTLVSQLTKSGQSVEAANVWHAMNPDAFLLALDHNLERVNNARFGSNTSLHKAMTQTERDSALKISTLAQNIGENVQKAKDVHALLTFTGTQRPLDYLEQAEVRKFLQSMKESMDAGVYKNLKDPDVIAYRDLIMKMDDGVDKASQDYLLSTLPDIIRLGSRERKIALQDMQAIKNGHDALEARLGRKLAVVHYLSLLWRVPTQVRNVLSNEAMWHADRLASTIAIPFDMARSTITGRRREIFWKTGVHAADNFFSPLGRDYENFWEGTKLGARAGWNGVNPEGLASKFEVGGLAFSGEGNIMSKTVNFMERTLGAAMKGADHGAFNRAYQRRLEMGAYAQAVEMANNLRKGGTKVTDEYVRKLTYTLMQQANSNMDNIARETGLFLTLQNDSVISRGLVKAKRGVNGLTGSKEFGLASPIIPFPKIPANIALKVIDYSPLGIGRDYFNLLKLSKAHKIMEEQFNLARANGTVTVDDMFNMSHADSALSNADWQMGMAFGRTLVGSGALGGMGWWLASKGLIWGSESKDMNKRKFDASNGKVGFQINISGVVRTVEAIWTKDTVADAAVFRPGDKLMTYEWLLPVMFPVAIAANTYKSIHEKGASKHVGAQIADNAGQSLDFVVQSSPLRGVRDVFNVNTYGSTTMAQQVGENFLQSVTGQLVPGILKDINNTVDNKVYETYDPSFTQGLLTRLQAAAPFSKNGLPQRVTTMGDPVVKEHNQFSLFSPFRMATYKESPAAKVINDILNETGAESPVPATAVKTIKYKVDGQDYTAKLSGQEWTALQQDTGLDLQKRLSLIDPSLPLVRRKYLVETAINAAAARSRNNLQHYTAIDTKAKKNQGIDISGLQVKK